MPSEWIAQRIRESLTEGERQEDLEYMLSALTQMRRPYHRETPEEADEAVAAQIMCFIIWPKPPKYVTAMRQVRTLFSIQGGCGFSRTTSYIRQLGSVRRFDS
jgi:hypothetical protein